MLGMIVLRGLVTGVKALERPLERLHTWTSIWAGAARAEAKSVITLKLRVTDEESEQVLDYMLANPTVVRAWREAQALEEMGEA